MDYGEKRIGLALSDPLRFFAKPLGVIPNEGYTLLVSKLKELIESHQITLIMIGIPYAIDGSNTPKTDECQALMNQLAQDLDVPVIGYDERYSTSEADAELKKLGYTWQEARRIKDAMAACMFLKDYLHA